jgi:hypothetical protein
MSPSKQEQGVQCERHIYKDMDSDDSDDGDDHYHDTDSDYEPQM